MTAGRVEGRVAVVTGAARGIGRACALRLAEEGADIAALDIGGPMPTVPYEASSPQQLEETASAVRALGRRCVPLVADVRDGEAMHQAVAAAAGELGSVDVLVAAAGIDSWGSAWELTDDQWDAMLAVNLKGVWQSAKAVSPHMISQQRGSMVFIGSVLSHRANKNFAHYTAAKHGLIGLMRVLAKELAPHNIRVNTLHPTTVATPMILNEPTYRLFRPDLENPTYDDFAVAARTLNKLPIVAVEPSDISNAVLYLVGDSGRYITGITHVIDAGGQI